ncbi:MAG: hypothetical protein HQL56_18175, partial [Magnetococcales bacterium]|nr:hypothetical protein [Magnetococcales bacterium]
MGELNDIKQLLFPKKSGIPGFSGCSGNSKHLKNKDKFSIPNSRSSPMRVCAGIYKYPRAHREWKSGSGNSRLERVAASAYQGTHRHPDHINPREEEMAVTTVPQKGTNGNRAVLALDLGSKTGWALWQPDG